MFFRRISRMKRREKEHKNLKMKGGVETALVLPIFLYLMLGVLFFVQFMETAGATEQKIHDRAKQMAVYAYASRKITDQDFHLGYSTFSGKEDEIDLVAAYRISSQMPVFSFGKPQIITCGCLWSRQRLHRQKPEEIDMERNIMPVHAVNPELVQQFILQIPAIVIMPDCLAAD